ncbi:hypothetical protein BDK63_002189 [Halomonas campaniensis]|uniref:Uncharacterized protein n=1 Tax=Halomonas campaniensis TaxID=213554 RepID=A0A7W5K3J7_9GAMM|nr:hypothetical protein [Halomonas campaniensis]MBB3331306.1 hypothetical protein [Halomonas campaniensis]
MNETDTRTELIDYSLKEACLGVVASSRVFREVITLGRLQGGRQRSSNVFIRSRAGLHD